MNFKENPILTGTQKITWEKAQELLDGIQYSGLFYMDMLNDTSIMGEIIYHIDPAIPLVIIDSAPIFKMFIESQVPYEYISSLDLLKALKDFDSGQEFIWIEFYDDGVTVYIGHLDEGLKPKFDFMVANKSFKNKEVEGTKEKHPPLPPGTQKITDLVCVDYLSIVAKGFGGSEYDQELLDGIQYSGGTEYKMNSETTNYKTTNDPIENYMNLKKLKNNILLDDVTAINRTLVLVYADSKSKKDYKERIDRFIGGLNTAETIKAVVITVTGDKIYQGVTFENPPSDEKFDPDLLESIKSKFVQVIEVRNGNG